MQVSSTEELLRELTEWVIVSEAGICMLVVDKLASQESRSEGPMQSNLASCLFFAMALENMAGEPESEDHAPKGVISHTVRAQDGQEFGFHAARHQIVVALITAWLL